MTAVSLPWSRVGATDIIHGKWMLAKLSMAAVSSWQSMARATDFTMVTHVYV